jgi:hypothetical protein
MLRTTMDLRAEVESTISGTGTISKRDYLRWSREGDLATRARVYELTSSQWPRIQPTPQMAEHCEFMADYLLDCLLTDPADDGFTHSAFEAGYAIAAWLKHLVNKPEAKSVIEDMALRLGRAYKASDAITRKRIETGALEHALESPGVRPFFSLWATDPVLIDAYEPALQWGLAHSEDAG